MAKQVVSMEYELSEEFDAKFKKQNIRLRKVILKTLDVFSDDPDNPQLDNHPLTRELEGLRSIHIIEFRSNDYCAIYKEMVEKDGSVYAYFLNFGTHKELFY